MNTYTLDEVGLVLQNMDLERPNNYYRIRMEKSPHSTCVSNQKTVSGKSIHLINVGMPSVELLTNILFTIGQIYRHYSSAGSGFFQIIYYDINLFYTTCDSYIDALTFQERLRVKDEDSVIIYWYGGKKGFKPQCMPDRRGYENPTAAILTTEINITLNRPRLESQLFLIPEERL